MRFVLVATLAFLTLFSACGGDGGSDSGVVIQGTLTQGSGGHDRVSNPILLHGAGERIGEVEICALGECSVTDSNGVWGFLVESDFSGGDVLFSLVGHGIDAETVVNIPENVNEVSIAFVNTEHGVVAQEIAGDHSHD